MDLHGTDVHLSRQAAEKDGHAHPGEGLGEDGCRCEYLEDLLLGDSGRRIVSLELTWFLTLFLKNLWNDSID